MPKELTIEVTQEDIDKGLAQPVWGDGCWGEKCPVAFALIRMGFYHPWVTGFVVRVDIDNSKSTIYEPSEELIKYIDNIDRTHIWQNRAGEIPDQSVYPVVPATFVVYEREN